MALHRPVIDRVVERGHDHGLIEHQAAMTYRASDWTDGVIKASVGAVDAGVQGPQVDDVRIGLLRQNRERKERRMRCYRILAGAAVTLRQPQVRVACVPSGPVVGKKQTLDTEATIVAGVVCRA